MGSSTNRNLAAKFAKSKIQKVDFARNETTKASNMVKVSDGMILTAAIAGRSDVVMVQGREIRRVAMVTRETVSVVTVGKDTLTRTSKVEKSQSMRQYLRSMF